MKGSVQNLGNSGESLSAFPVAGGSQGYKVNLVINSGRWVTGRQSCFPTERDAQPSEKDGKLNKLPP